MPWRLRALANWLTRGQQFFVGGLGDGAVVGLKNNGGLVLNRRAYVLIQAIGRCVEFAIFEPPVKRRIGLVEGLREGLGPDHVFSRQAGPEAFKIFLGFGA